MLILECLGTVFAQVCSLFMLMAVGFVMFKAKLIDKSGINAMSNVLIWGATPCILIESFGRGFDRTIAVSMAVFSLCAAVMTVFILYSVKLLLKKRYGADSDIMSFACAFSNCGFMGIPLAQAVCGDEGAMYASVFVAVFNLIQWTLGYSMLTGKGISLKKLFINPGIIGIAVGLPIFIFSIKLPTLVASTVASIADLNTPLAMIVIGGHLASSDMKSAIADKKAFLVCLLKLVAIPIIAIGLVYVLPIPLTAIPLLTLIIEFAAPCGATTVLIGTLCGRDCRLGGSCVALSTLLSLVTMPLIISLAKQLLM